VSTCSASGSPPKLNCGSTMQPGCGSRWRTASDGIPPVEQECATVRAAACARAALNRNKRELVAFCLETPEESSPGTHVRIIRVRACKMDSARSRAPASELKLWTMSFGSTSAAPHHPSWACTPRDPATRSARRGRRPMLHRWRYTPVTNYNACTNDLVSNSDPEPP